MGKAHPISSSAGWGRISDTAGVGVVLSLWRFGVWQVKSNRFSRWWLAVHLLGSSASDIVVLGSGSVGGGRLC